MRSSPVFLPEDALSSARFVVGQVLRRDHRVQDGIDLLELWCVSPAMLSLEDPETYSGVKPGQLILPKGIAGVFES